jgi:hypothetical protein
MNDALRFMMTTTQSKRWRILRRGLLGAAVLLTLIATFYTEESWRGKRAWENCKRELEAKGVKMDWADSIPAPVPDDQNFFAAPEMQKLFVGRGAMELRGRIYDVLNSNRPPARVAVAAVAIGLPGTIPPPGLVVLAFGEPRAKTEVGRLIQEAVGPSCIGPLGLPYVLRRPEEIQPAKIFLQCPTAPTAKELEQFLPTSLISEWSMYAGDKEKVQVDPAGPGAYQVTIPWPTTTADCLAWNASLEGEFTMIRKALQRPYARMRGDNENPDPDFLPTFELVPTIARRLAAMAQCHLLQGQPEEALDDLTLLHDLSRVPESQPSTRWSLVSILIHETVTAVYTSVIADGLRSHVWREPQLVALRQQLKQINFLPDLRQDTLAGPARMSHYFETITPSQLGELALGFPSYSYPYTTNSWTRLKSSLAGHFFPRGWVYQNLVQLANTCQILGDSIDPSGQMVFPRKVDAAGVMARSHVWLYAFVAIRSMPSRVRPFLTTAKVQTQVHEALIACALERCRLEHKAYPETLDALVPQFLDKIPPDLIGGQPLHYRRADDGKFVLYSVGWNETDDGGKPASDDDWVWDDTAR